MPGYFFWLQGTVMNRLIVPAAIFISVMFVGKVFEHLGVEGNVKFGLLCLIAIVVQVVVTRHLRSRAT